MIEANNEASKMGKMVQYSRIMNALWQLQKSSAALVIQSYELLGWMVGIKTILFLLQMNHVRFTGIFLLLKTQLHFYY